jgi:hypothetical protein
MAPLVPFAAPAARALDVDAAIDVVWVLGMVLVDKVLGDEGGGAELVGGLDETGRGGVRPPVIANWVETVNCSPCVIINA